MPPKKISVKLKGGDTATKKTSQKSTLKGDLYDMFKTGRSFTLAQIASALYQSAGIEQLQRAYGVVSACRRDAEENGILLHRVNIEGRDVYKFLTSADEVRTRIEPTKTRIAGGLRKMILIKALLSRVYKSPKDVEKIGQMMNAIKLTI